MDLFPNPRDSDMNKETPQLFFFSSFCWESRQQFTCPRALREVLPVFCFDWGFGKEDKTRSGKNGGESALRKLPLVLTQPQKLYYFIIQCMRIWVGGCNVWYVCVEYMWVCKGVSVPMSAHTEAEVGVECLPLLLCLWPWDRVFSLHGEAIISARLAHDLLGSS